MRCKTYKTRLFVLLSIFGAFRAPCTNTFHFFWLGWYHLDIFVHLFQVASPIEGLPDVEESHCISAQQLDWQVVYLGNERASPSPPRPSA